MNQWYALDPLSNLNDAKDSYYHWSNLYVGSEIDVYSRKIILFNCDEFTKQFYSDHGLGRLYKYYNNSKHDLYIYIIRTII